MMKNRNYFEMDIAFEKIYHLYDFILFIIV